MGPQKSLLLTMTLLAVTLTLAESCRFLPGYVCAPDQRLCNRRGGKCSLLGGRCQCVNVRQFYDIPPGYTTNAPDPPSFESGRVYIDRFGRRRMYIEPGSSRDPMAESNMERRTDMMVSMSRMYNMMNRYVT
ncbi:uncharacterized protein [Littorina saxatilis]|uniref:uncharacterized protein n=1 Tax=Littorina saxatilis TaxID=31220 RepID=UPI0038B61035